MILDLNAYTGEARKRLIYLGRQYSSEDTLKQADKTLAGLKTYGAPLILFGFSKRDAALLGDARDTLIAAGVTRSAVQGSRKVTNKDYDGAIKEGKLSREGARSVLDGALRELRLTAKEEAGSATNELETTLAQTSQTSDDASILANQLELLQATLQRESLKEVLAERGGPEISKGLPEQIKSLRSAASKDVAPRGTPEETERLDLTDGIIIELVRSAKKSAKVLSKRLGQPSILVSFALDHLYPTPQKNLTPLTPAAPVEEKT
jgi:polyhydroxyalkanoate synthesis regulator phasin